jgi:hypothetical protein
MDIFSIQVDTDLVFTGLSPFRTALLLPRTMTAGRQTTVVVVVAATGVMMTTTAPDGTGAGLGTSTMTGEMCRGPRGLMLTLPPLPEADLVAGGVMLTGIEMVGEEVGGTLLLRRTMAPLGGMGMKLRVTEVGEAMVEEVVVQAGAMPIRKTGEEGELDMVRGGEEGMVGVVD